MTLLYSFVARDTVILAEHAQCGGNFAQVAMDCLAKIDNPESRFTLKGKEHLLNFVVDDGFTFLVVSEENYPREICFYFLEQVRCISRVLEAAPKSALQTPVYSRPAVPSHEPPAPTCL